MGWEREAGSCMVPGVVSTLWTVMGIAAAALVAFNVLVVVLVASAAHMQERRRPAGGFESELSDDHAA